MKALIGIAGFAATDVVAALVASAFIIIMQIQSPFIAVAIALLIGATFTYIVSQFM